MNKEKKMGLEIWRLIYPILIYFGINILATLGYMVVEAIRIAATGIVDPMIITEKLMQNLMDNALLITIITSIISLIVLIPLYFADQRKEKRIGEFIKYEKSSLTKWILVAILGFSAALSLNFIISFTGLAELSSGFDAVSEAIYGSSIFFQILATVIMAPLCEEILVRGLIYKRMRRWANPLVAALVSSTLFGLIHMNLVQFIYAFLIGLLLALVYEKFQNIWAPILFHFVANGTSISISNIPGLEELFESDVISISVCAVTTIALIVLAIYFIKTRKVDGTKIEIEKEPSLDSQIEVQEREKEMYN